MGITADSGGVRSVERALAIVDLLGEHQALGLEELHYLTALPKATVSRMIATLQAQGWVYRGLADRRYRLCARRLFGDRQLRFKRRLVESAAPMLLELSERTGLVADLSCFDGQRLEVMESAIPQVLRKRYPHTSQIVGQHASLFHSAMGRACLGSWRWTKCSAWRPMSGWVTTGCCAISKSKRTRALVSAPKATGNTRCACRS